MASKEQILEQIEKWRPLIIKLSNKYANKIAAAEDLMSVGILSIINNIDKCDKTRGNLGTFLFKCIRNAITSYAISNCFPISVPLGSGSMCKKTKMMRGDPGAMERVECKDPNFDFFIDINDIIRANDVQGMAYKYFIENKTYEEISQEVQVSTATISRHISTVREKIREYMQSE